MKAADDRMYFLNAAGGLRLFDRIDDATVTAGGDYDQTFAFDHEVRSDLVLKIIQKS